MTQRPSVPTLHGDPVVVVGAGPVGLTQALLLARWGIPVVVLDRLPERQPVGSKAICQHRDVLDVWSAIGIGEQVAAEGVTWTTARTFYREHELFSVRFQDRGQSPFPPFVNISQARVETLLDERAAGEPLIEVHWDHAVSAIDQREGAVVVETATEGGHRSLRAAAVVACAGVHDQGLRERLGVSYEGSTFHDKFLICDVEADLPGWESERRFHFDPSWNPGRQVLLHPCPAGTFRIDWQVPRDFDLEAEEASGALDARVRRIVGDRPYRMLWRTVYRFHALLVDRMRLGRVLLAGDCAHVMAPFGARGLNSGVQDAENAAWKLAFVLHGWAPEALLETYHDERHAAARENLGVTSETMRFLAPQSEAEWARRRRVLERAIADPAARADVNSGRLAEPFWYSDSPLTTPDLTRPTPRRPVPGEAQTPAPGVLVPDLPVRLADRPDVTRLRQLVRNGLLALLGAEVDAEAAARALAEAVPAPTRVERVSGSEVADALGMRPAEVWLLRPDGHVAAILDRPDPDALAEAARRAIGWASP